ncbi:MAG TPA: GNAT family N-acetyltransferase [Nostocaceae cyanobacterium]|nr:GNAT family N-acetyltransferase [Nostocaceae cyanobacterium]
MELLNLEISTPHLLIKPIDPEYLEVIFQEFTPEVATYLYHTPTGKITDTEIFINKSVLDMEKGDHLVVVILRKDSQEFLGCSGINDIKTKYPQTGLWLKKSVHGQGYGTETITALKKWADQNLDYEYLRYPVDQANIASRRIPEKLGGYIVKEYDHTNLAGRVLNILEYGIPKN